MYLTFMRGLFGLADRVNGTAANSRPSTGRRDKAYSWRLLPMKALWVGVCLAEIPCSDFSSQAQNVRQSGADDPYRAVDGSAREQGQTGTSAQTSDRPSGIGPCMAQQPFLLKSYMVRPSWPVAGVDYCVGYPTNTVLKAPGTISMAGVSVNTTTHIVTVTGNNITLDGYDFSLDGGWQVNVQAANTKIANSNFVVGSNDLLPIVGTPTASDLDVVNCTIDGAGHAPGPWGTLIAYRGMSFTVEYSWLKNSGGDMIQTIGGAGTVTIENNLIQDAGMIPGAHGDYTQLEGGPFTVQINYNTTTQDGGSTQGLMTQDVAQGQIANNTMVGSVSYFTSLDLQSLTGTVTVQNNYFDKSKAFGFVYPTSRGAPVGPNDGNSKSVFIHNVNMRTGAVVQDFPGR